MVTEIISGPKKFRVPPQPTPASFGPQSYFDSTAYSVNRTFCTKYVK